MLVDSHAHLDAPEFGDDLEEVLDRAEKARLDAILTIGCLNENPQVAPRILKLIESKPYLFAAFGIHPHDAQLFNQERKAEVERLMGHPKVIGLGEIGLDYYYDHSPNADQRKAFREQIRLAKRLQIPIIVHTRDAENETIELLEEEFIHTDENVGIMHCFAGSLSLAQRCISLGFLISFGGILTFKNADELRRTAEQLPEDRLLVETDSPYLAPVPHRGKRNEPAFVKDVVEQLAALKGRSTREIVNSTGANFRSLFKLEETVAPS
jgi:TatD DNase family protein